MMVMQTRPTLRFLLLGLVFASLAGCGGGSDLSDLKAKMAEIKARPRGRIEPPPEFKSIANFTYADHQMRSPFSPPTEQKKVKVPEGKKVEPDFTRPKEYLEKFGLDSLKMVGTISKQGTPLEALIQDPTGAVNRVKVGSHMGKHYGRVIKVTQSQIDLVEIVPNGKDGWVERSRTMKIVE